ncbi:MAG: hypothetical protein KBD63_01960 [Bacteriovoracaceae bacterium]|nr:hypothetical protein [Bacteriovoracaceae bacterium]
MEIKCYKCQKKSEVSDARTFSRTEECSHCYAAFKCCRMCLYYDLAAYNECREPSAGRMVDKEKANFCEFFTINPDPQQMTQKDDLLKAAMALFKNENGDKNE